jgi:hypothetical protein
LSGICGGIWGSGSILGVYYLGIVDHRHVEEEVEETIPVAAAAD